jgi:hypothetical protein
VPNQFQLITLHGLIEKPSDFGQVSFWLVRTTASEASFVETTPLLIAGCRSVLKVRQANAKIDIRLWTSEQEILSRAEMRLNMPGQIVQVIALNRSKVYRLGCCHWGPTLLRTVVSCPVDENAGNRFT